MKKIADLRSVVTCRPRHKRTEVGLIPEDWGIASLESVTSTIGDGIHATPIYSPNSDYYFINGNNIRDGQVVITEDTKSVDFSEFRKHRKELNDHTVLLSINGTIGNVAVYSQEPVVLGKSAAYLNVKNVDRDYFFYALQTRNVAKQFDDGLTGTTIKNLGLGTIRSTQIPIPSTLLEQRAIAAALSDVDELIGALDKLIAKKRAIKLATMQQLLTGKTRLPGFSGEWSKTTLGELADIQRGASPRPIESLVWYDTESKIGWVRISDIANSDGRTLLATRNYLSAKGVAASRFIPASTLIMSICATVGRPVVTGFDTCIHDGFVSFCNLRHVNQGFLFYALKELEADFATMGQTGSQANLNTDIVKGCEISLPSLDEQVAIAGMLSDMDAEIAALEQRRDKTKAIKQGMMQSLLTGRVRLVENG